METKLHLGEDSGQGFTQIMHYPAGVALSKLGLCTQAWYHYPGWVKLPWAGWVTLISLGKVTQLGKVTLAGFTTLPSLGNFTQFWLL